MTFQTILPFIFVAPPVLYGIFTLYCGRSFFSRESRAGIFQPPVSIIKPVKGIDADSMANFTSFCLQDYPQFQIIFAVASADDPAIPVLRELISRFPDVDLELVVDSRVYGANYKVCNLINAFGRAKYDYLIASDCDIRVEPNYLREVCAHFADPTVGLVTSLYRSRKMEGYASVIEALGFTAEMVPNVMASLLLEDFSFALGASMAVRREALEKIGGFPALVDYLADDYQLGNMVYRAGYRLALSGHFVESVMKRESLPSILSRQLRWARTMRVSRPWGYFASGVTQPVPLALLALVFSGFTTDGWLAVLLLACVRVLCVCAYSRLYVRDNLLPRYLWLLPVRDALAFAIWVLSFIGNRIVWRGNTFRLLPGGKIIETVKF